ncbi:MAG TPA: hypothetical protein VK559_13255 [Ferruginibacter sp.]|nr:hypothetical protein [Ferruginibacter sp.]
MKRITPHFILLICCLCSFQFSIAQKGSLRFYDTYFQNQLAGWTKTIRRFKLSAFKKTGVLAFEKIDYADGSSMKDFYSIYKPALTFSNDSAQFIDIYSYWLVLERKESKIISHGGEPEQAATLFDLSTKKWTRIFFCGYAERIQEVIWTTNTTFIMVGVSEENDSTNHPIIYIGNTITKSFDVFTSDDQGCYQYKYGYDSPKLLSLKIHEE